MEPVPQQGSTFGVQVPPAGFGEGLSPSPILIFFFFIFPSPENVHGKAPTPGSQYGRSSSL
jgi:hypothetical protein